MTYHSITRGIFLARPNRFIAQVETEDGPQVCHVKKHRPLPGAAGAWRSLFIWRKAKIPGERHDMISLP